jgi:hypothetical protein
MSGYLQNGDRIAQREPGALPDLEFAVGLGGRNNHVLGAAVAAMRVAQILVIRRCHHVEERGDIGIIHQRQVVPLIAVLLTERDRLGIAGARGTASD